MSYMIIPSFPSLALLVMVFLGLVTYSSNASLTSWIRGVTITARAHGAKRLGAAGHSFSITQGNQAPFPSSLPVNVQNYCFEFHESDCIPLLKNAFSKTSSLKNCSFQFSFEDQTKKHRAANSSLTPTLLSAMFVRLHGAEPFDQLQSLLQRYFDLVTQELPHGRRYTLLLLNRRDVSPAEAAELETVLREAVAAAWIPYGLAASASIEGHGHALCPKVQLLHMSETELSNSVLSAENVKILEQTLSAASTIGTVDGSSTVSPKSDEPFVLPAKQYRARIESFSLARMGSRLQPLDLYYPSSIAVDSPPLSLMDSQLEIISISVRRYFQQQQQQQMRFSNTDIKNFLSFMKQQLLRLSFSTAATTSDTINGINNANKSYQLRCHLLKRLLLPLHAALVDHVSKECLDGINRDLTALVPSIDISASEKDAIAVANKWKAIYYKTINDIGLGFRDILLFTTDLSANSTINIGSTITTNRNNIFSRAYLSSEIKESLTQIANVALDLEEPSKVSLQRLNPLNWKGKECRLNNIGFENGIRDGIRQHRARQLLDGLANPYLTPTTLLGLPPLHVGLHYLLDVQRDVVPWFFTAADDLNRLYDTHVIGVCANRANPLFVDGYRILPFQETAKYISMTR